MDTQETKKERPVYYRSLVRLRIVAEKIEGEKPQIKSSRTAAEFCRQIGLDKEAQEVGLILFLDTKNRISGYIEISRGTINTTIISPREVFKAAILLNSARVMFVHNHPSGEVQPSTEDREITKALSKAGKLLDIELLDSLIIGDKTHYSFKENSAFGGLE